MKALIERSSLPQSQCSLPRWPQSKQSQAWEIPFPFVPGVLVPRHQYQQHKQAMTMLEFLYSLQDCTIQVGLDLVYSQPVVHVLLPVR